MPATRSARTVSGVNRGQSRNGSRRRKGEADLTIGNALLLPHAIHVIADPAGRIRLLDEAMDVGVEAGELRVERAGELEVLDDSPVETLARNQQRNARRIGRQQNARHAALELVDLDAVD